MSVTEKHPMAEQSRERNSLVAADPLRYSSHPDSPFEVASMMISQIPAGARVLDVGCGTGVLSLKVAAERQADVVGIEPNPDRALAAKNAGVNVLQGELTSGLESLGKFDVLIFADVLEHIPDPLETLHICHEYLNPNGVVVASIPNVANWIIRWELLRGRWDYAACGIMDATHLRWFTKKSVIELFENAGFNVTNYAVTAGTHLPEYKKCRFYYWLSPWHRFKLLTLLIRFMPTLFGAQHVITAVRGKEQINNS